MSNSPDRSGAGSAAWHEVGVAVGERHTHFAESAQGVATDGQRWFVVSNRSHAMLMRKLTNPKAIFGYYSNTRRVGVYALDGAKQREIAPDPDVWAELVDRNKRQGRKPAIHLGAPCWARGTLLVPTQRPSGVWAISHDLTQQTWWPDPAPTRPERFSWIDHEPGNGLLYTSLHWHPAELQALEWGSLRRVPAADIVLGEAPVRLDRVQGGAFTEHGRILLSSSNDRGQIFCYARDGGECIEVLDLRDFREMEGLAVRRVLVAGEPADVHILDAGTHYWPFAKWGDWFAVRSYRTSL
jgi:hypothetical protein